MNNKRDLALGKTNFIMLAIGMAIVILGFILMAGGGSDEHTFDPEIFSTMRIKVAPVVCFIGFVSIILTKKRGKQRNEHTRSNHPGYR